MFYGCFFSKHAIREAEWLTNTHQIFLNFLAIAFLNSHVSKTFDLIHNHFAKNQVPSYCFKVNG